MKKLIRNLIGVTSALVIAVTINITHVDTAKAADKEVFTYAMTGLYPPFSFRQSGDLYGFDMEVGQALAEEMGMQPNPVSNPWQTLIAALKSDRFDAIIGSMAITEERLKQVNFTDPYYSSGAQVFVSTDNDEITEVEGIRGKTIGVLVSSSFAKAAREYSDNITTYTDDVTALRDLTVGGRVDAVITDQLIGENAILNAGLEVKPLGDPIYVDDIGIAVNKGNEAFLEKLNQALAKIKANGKYEEISEKYFGRNIAE